MKDHMLIEEIKNSNDREFLYNRVLEELKRHSQKITSFDKNIQLIANMADAAKKDFEVYLQKNNDRTITPITFEQKEAQHQYRISALQLQSMEYQREKLALQNLCARLNCLAWLLKLPFGVEKREFVNKGKKVTVRKKDIYNDYFKLIIDSTLNELIAEQSFYRLQLYFNKMPDATHNKFYKDEEIVKNRLGEVQEKILEAERYKKQVNDDYLEYVDYNKVTVGDFFNDNSEQLFESFYVDNYEEEMGRAM